MSKKSSRAKKGDSNAGNFVFKVGADAPSSPSFNFSGSQPGSPVTASASAFNFSSSNPASPVATGGSFNFGGGGAAPGSPASTSTQPFVFGNNAASASSPTTNTAFNFGSPNTSASTLPGFGSQAAGAASPTIKRHVSEINSLTAPPDRSSSLRRSASEIAFGASSNPSTPPATNPSAFNFGTPVGSPSTASSTFNFNAPAGNSTTTPALNIAPLNTQTSANSFGSSFSATSQTASTQAAPAATFGSFGSPSTTPKIGSGAAAGAPASPASAFNFITPKSTAGTTGPATPTFSFGSAPAATSSATAAPSAAATTSGSSSLFGFNKSAGSTPAASTDKPATPSISFGSAATSTATTPQTSAPAAPASTGFGGFSFNKPTETPTTSAATSSASTTKPTFTFNTPTQGSDDKGKSATTTPSLNFGSVKPATSSATPASTAPTFSFSKPTSEATPSSSSSTTTTTSTMPKFSFSSDKDKKDDGKPTVTSSPFSFTAPAATTSTTTPGSTTATTTTVDPNKPNPFAFDKVLDDLAKIAAQPPSQMYASLITPALAATIQQSQVVNHTNFRIDNIMSTTRFTELPEQAQKELDELEKYIKMESQRCEYIGKQKMPKHLDVMDNARKNTEILSQQLDALSSTLKVRMANVETLYEAVKEQLRHANDGCAVLEACKHPGNNARWLFGYSEDDDYFSQLARQLSGRVEEYKRCIWEVERTAESWTQNKVQSPQDIAVIMRNQNKAFLALSNKVASLHETVNAEKNYYYQYLKMYS